MEARSIPDPPENPYEALAPAGVAGVLLLTLVEIRMYGTWSAPVLLPIAAIAAAVYLKIGFDASDRAGRCDRW